LENAFSLTKADLAERTNDGKDSKFEKEVRWARKDLEQKGIIQKAELSGRGTWKLESGATISPVLCDDPATLINEARKLISDKRLPVGQKKPEKIDRRSSAYRRDAAVVAAVWRLSDGICESCRNAAPFLSEHGEPFLEVHHVKTLANGGSDTISNAVAVCPNCHRELHLGKNAEINKENLYRQIGRLVRE
jgi:hypothetical protein